MTGIIHFETFLFAGILLNLTPGNDTIFILSKSIGQGRKAGIISAIGIGAGCIVHTMMAAFGLSLVIAKSIMLFNVIKIAGAAYLVYMGYKMIVEKNGLNTAAISSLSSSPGYFKIFRDGVITNILNPKVALFFIAFLPQFIDPAVKSPEIPFLILGFTFILTGTAWCLLLACFAAVIFKRLKNNKQSAILINRICGWTLVALGVKVAITNPEN